MLQEVAQTAAPQQVNLMGQFFVSFAINFFTFVLPLLIGGWVILRFTLPPLLRQVFKDAVRDIIYEQVVGERRREKTADIESVGDRRVGSGR